MAEVRRSVCICGIAVDEGNHADGLLGEGEARCLDEIAANVHQRAAAGIQAVADVCRIDVEVAEEAEDRAQLARCGLRRATPAGGATGDGCGP